MLQAHFLWDQLAPVHGSNAIRGLCQQVHLLLAESREPGGHLLGFQDGRPRLDRAGKHPHPSCRGQELWAMQTKTKAK